MNDSRPTVVTQSSAVKTKMRFCKYCGSPIKDSICTGCGKKTIRPGRIIGIISVILSITIVLFIAVYFPYNYIQAVKATSRMNFSKAKQHYDRLIIADKIFSGEYAYIDACILVERGAHVAALEELKSVKNYSPSQAMIEYLTVKIYADGIDAYEDGLYQTARHCFEAIAGHENSSNYACLARCHLGEETDMDKNRLPSLIGFADAEDIILSDHSFADPFLDGRWELDDTYLVLNSSTDTIDHNIPVIGKRDYYIFQNGVCYSATETSGSISYEEYKNLKVAHFQVQLCDADTIRIFCYADGNSYTLYRK